MAISKGFRYKDKEGKVTDYEYGVNGSNVTQDSEHRLVTDEEKQTWNDKADLEDIPSGSAASHAVANNCTTTAAGSVLDARQGKVLMDKANQLSSDLKFPDGTGFYPDIKDGQQGYNTDPARGADTFHPFKNVEYLGEKQGSVSDGRYATFNISDYANYQGITVDNIFPTISYMMHSSNGDGAGTMSWSYNPEAGMLTFDNGDNSLVSIRAKIYVI